MIRKRSSRVRTGSFFAARPSVNSDYLAALIVPQIDRELGEGDFTVQVTMQEIETTRKDRC